LEKIREENYGNKGELIEEMDMIQKMDPHFMDAKFANPSQVSVHPMKYMLLPAQDNYEQLSDNKLYANSDDIYS